LTVPPTSEAALHTLVQDSVLSRGGTLALRNLLRRIADMVRAVPQVYIPITLRGAPYSQALAFTKALPLHSVLAELPGMPATRHLAQTLTILMDILVPTLRSEGPAGMAAADDLVQDICLTAQSAYGGAWVAPEEEQCAALAQSLISYTSMRLLGVVEWEAQHKVLCDGRPAAINMTEAVLLTLGTLVRGVALPSEPIGPYIGLNTTVNTILGVLVTMSPLIDHAQWALWDAAGALILRPFIARQEALAGHPGVAGAGAGAGAGAVPTFATGALPHVCDPAARVQAPLLCTFADLVNTTYVQ